MGRLVLVCVGGAIGSAARYIVALWSVGSFGSDFPRGTLLVNVLGSFIIAVVMELSLRTAAVTPNVRLFLTTGLMGGFTTYSSFNYESFRLLEDGASGLALLYVGGTVVGCFVSGALGIYLVRLLLRAGAGVES